jgi:PhnB protein
LAARKVKKKLISMDDEDSAEEGILFDPPCHDVRKEIVAMSKFEPYLSFNGNCAEAMRFYETTLGGKIEMSMTYGEAPPMPGQPAPSGDAAKRIMHTSMTLDGHRLMASDMPPGMPFGGIKGMMVSLAYTDAAKGKAIFDALSAGGEVTMPYQKTFWADGFGMCTDKFGTPWMVNAGDAGGAAKK